MYHAIFSAKMFNVIAKGSYFAFTLCNKWRQKKIYQILGVFKQS